MLAGYDQKSNVVLSESKERVYSLDEGVEEVPLGLYLVKGDMMYVSARSFLPPCPHFQPPTTAAALRVILFICYDRHCHMIWLLPAQKSLTTC